MIADLEALENRQASAHEWWVFSTALKQRWLMLFCEKTRQTGSVRDPSTQEWADAFTAPSKPYRWHQDARVHIDPELEERP
jgi:hypothetical protein